jgi:hypothetical protein
MDFIKNAASSDAHVFYGQVFDDGLEDRFMVTVIATGFPPARGKRIRSNRRRPAPVRRFVREAAPLSGRPRTGRRWKCLWGRRPCGARRICAAKRGSSAVRGSHGSATDIAESFKRSDDRGASDIHIGPGFVPMLRLHGDLEPALFGQLLSPEDTRPSPI